MAAEKAGIEVGMKVYGLDGRDLGTISKIWADIDETPDSSRDYLKVDEGGFLGIGARALYIPLEAVSAVAPGESVTVNCSKEQCIELFAVKPDSIKKKEEEVMAAEAAVIASTTSVILH